MKVANTKSWLKCSANNGRDCVRKSFDFASIEDLAMMRKCHDWACEPHPEQGTSLCDLENILIETMLAMIGAKCLLKRS